MRPQDKLVFLEAASHFQVWILVRRTNVASLKYIGKPGYIPKRIDCKAKTADLDKTNLKLAGLVVSPIVHPKSFKPTKVKKSEGILGSNEPADGHRLHRGHGYQVAALRLPQTWKFLHPWRLRSL